MKQQHITSVKCAFKDGYMFFSVVMHTPDDTHNHTISSERKSHRGVTEPKSKPNAGKRFCLYPKTSVKNVNPVFGPRHMLMQVAS